MRNQHRMVGAWVLVLALSVGITETSQAQARSEIELTRQQIQSERQELVAVGMELTEEQASAFWPVYREYRNEQAPVGDRLVELILGYAQQVGEVSDEYAERMLEDYLDIQSDVIDVKKKYVDRFKRVLPARLVARFYQIENKLDAVVNMDLAMSVPVLQ